MARWKLWMNLVSKISQKTIKALKRDEYTGSDEQMIWLIFLINLKKKYFTYFFRQDYALFLSYGPLKNMDVSCQQNI